MTHREKRRQIYGYSNKTHTTELAHRQILISRYIDINTDTNRHTDRQTDPLTVRHTLIKVQTVIYLQTDRQTKHAVTQTDRRTDRQSIQSYIKTDRQAGRQTTKWAGGRTDEQTDRQTDRQKDTQADRQPTKQTNEETSSAHVLCTYYF